MSCAPCGVFSGKKRCSAGLMVNYRKLAALGWDDETSRESGPPSLSVRGPTDQKKHYYEQTNLNCYTHCHLFFNLLCVKWMERHWADGRDILHVCIQSKQKGKDQRGMVSSLVLNTIHSSPQSWTIRNIKPIIVLWKDRHKNQIDLESAKQSAWWGNRWWGWGGMPVSSGGSEIPHPRSDSRSRSVSSRRVRVNGVHNTRILSPLDRCIIGSSGGTVTCPKVRQVGNGRRREKVRDSFLLLLDWTKA